MVVENTYSFQLRQQCLRCNYTKFEFKIFQEYTIFGQFYYRNDWETKRDIYWNVWSSMENLSINLKPSVCLEEILLLLLLKLLWKNLHSVIKHECINTKSMGKKSDGA